MPKPGIRLQWRRREALALLASAAFTGAPARAQDIARLRPGESVEVPGGHIAVLGVDLRRGNPARVTLRLRATADAQHELLIDLDAFRLIAAGVPRAPEYQTTAERQMSSFLVGKDSAIDFTRVFNITDRTDDLVLQIRVGGAVEKRRLSGG
jgi:hypothetical protein